MIINSRYKVNLYTVYSTVCLNIHILFLLTYCIRGRAPCWLRPRRASRRITPIRVGDPRQTTPSSGENTVQVYSRIERDKAAGMQVQSKFFRGGGG